MKYSDPSDLINEVVSKAKDILKVNDMRPGQAAMNALHAIDPDLYHDVVRDESADCFYDDSRLPAFYGYIALHPAVKLACECYGIELTYNISTHGWTARREEMNCEFFWSSLTGNAVFFQSLTRHFKEVGAQIADLL